jgi:hypothetical protein
MNTPREREREPLRTSDLAAAAAGAQQTRQEVDRGEERPIEREEPIERDSDRSPASDDGRLQAGDDGRREATGDGRPRETTEAEQLEPLFSTGLAHEYRSRWIALQGSFVDDPRRAVQQGDELVAEVMQSLAQTFADERAGLEDDLAQTGDASTEALRITLRRYRSFFERLLSL